MFDSLQCIKEQTLIRPIRDEFYITLKLKRSQNGISNYNLYIKSASVNYTKSNIIRPTGCSYTSHRYMSKGIRPEHIIKDTCI